MRIATFNINGVNRRLPMLLDWLATTRPDIVCLQELKATHADFPADALRDAGYHAVWQGQRTWNGVAILSRGLAPVVTRRRLPGNDADDQARYLEAAIEGVLIGCLYLPNGNPRPGPKFDYKLAWFARLADHARGLLAAGVPVVLAGDFNVVPTAADLYPTRSWDRDALLHPAVRVAFAGLLAQGWTDALARIAPDGPLWTYWDYKRDAWPRDAGLRIDHLLLSPDLAARLSDAGVDRSVRGQVGASDHAPAWITLDPARRRRPRRLKVPP